MIENFLHYVWLYKKFNPVVLKTTQNEQLQIFSVGTPNHNSGPDFFNGLLRIADQLWAGNIEIHLKSSDWFVHQHDKDSAYDNVILHVVYKHDTEIFRKDGTRIPTLELKDIIDKNVLDNYYRLFSKQKKWIHCEHGFGEVSGFLMENWFERLFIERLERKSKLIMNLLKASKNDWEAVLFKMLSKSFGLKVNGEAFLSMANSFDFSIVRKVQANLNQMEALFFGQAAQLDGNCNEPYFLKLQKEYHFLKQKFGLDNTGVFPLRFFRLRPSNFPTIRLSQLASLYHKQTQLFTTVISAKAPSEFYRVFEVSASEFWQTHYNFQSISRKTSKHLTKTFTDLILINTVLPLKFCYANHHGKDINEEILAIINTIDVEENTLVKRFSQLRPFTKSALQSQALIQLKTEYCDKHQCLKCAVGNSLLNK